MKTIFLVLGYFLFSILANASENPYIELAQPSDLTEIHVNTSQFNPNNGKVTKTEISFGDGTIVTNKSDVYHKYAAAGIYNVVVKIWTSANQMSTFSKEVDINPQYRILPIANSTVFFNPAPKNKKYSFSVSAAQAESLYKIRLTRASDASEEISYSKSSQACDLNLGVRINSIPIFKNEEIDCNTTVVEKLVKLKTLNEIVYDMQQSKKFFSTEISAVEIVKDYTAPTIDSSLSSGLLTKENKTAITITDESDTTTHVWDNQQNLLFSTIQKSFDISLLEGVNNFVIQSVDKYDNTSQYFYLTNIKRDSTPAMLNAILNSEYIYSSYPQNFVLTINSDEELQSLTVNGLLALWVAPKTYSYVLNVTSPGQVNIELRAYDLAGNETVKAYQPIFSIDNIAPTVSTSLADNTITSQESVRINVVDNADTVTEVYKNGYLIKSTTKKEFEIFFENQGANSYLIKSRDAYDNEAVDVHLNVVFDSVAPQVVLLTPEDGAIIRTNTLPLIIPVTVEFNEPVTTISINAVQANMISPTKATKEIAVPAAGPVIIRIETADLAGNATVVERTVIVEFSNVLPVLTLDASVKNMLTNKTEVRIFGTSNIKLATAKLNGADISVGLDGVSFSGFFEPPADGRYQVEVVGTDLFGNTGTVIGYVRVLSDLPDIFENYPQLSAIPTGTGYSIDYGPGFSEPSVSNVCDGLKNIFTQNEEFASNLQQLQKREDDLLKQFPEGYEPDVPTTASLLQFIGQIDEPLNYVKAGYLAVCERKIILPETDCAKNREILKLLTGQYPEPMIIRSIPGIAPFIQDFLISRYNICTGLDTSGLSCEDMKRILPLIANLTFPSVGQMMSSPVGQVVMDALMCKDICETPALKDTPYCTQPNLPNIPQITPPTDISVSVPDLNYPDLDLGSDDWSFGGGGSGSGCKWWEDCDDGGGGGGLPFPRLSCAQYPNMPKCVPELAEYFPEVTLDPDVQCPTATWTLADAINANSPMDYIISVLAKCVDYSIPGIPKVTPPSLTVLTPVMNQVVSDTVKVSGYVSDRYARVRVNGLDINIFPVEHGANFSTTISTPASMTVTVEAVNIWGTRATPVSILLKPSSPKYKFVEVGLTHICGITLQSALKCWSPTNIYFEQTYLGDGSFGPSYTPVQVLGMESGVTDVVSGVGYVCAIKNGALYCWGSNNTGHLGTGTFANQAVPVPITGFESGVKTVSVQGRHTCVLKYDGSLYCWGNNENGQLGVGVINGRFDYRPAPILLFGAGSGVDFLRVGPAQTCIRKSNEHYCWGFNPYQNLGIASLDQQIVSPTKVVAVGTDAIDLHPNSFNTCGVKNGGAYCWAGGSAAVVPGLESGVTALRAGFVGNCALKGGRVFCWGDRFGSSPTDMGFTSVTVFAVGYRSVCAISNNEIACTYR